MQRAVGKVRVTMVRESCSPVPAGMLFPDPDPTVFERHAAWLTPHYMDSDDNLLISIHALILESAGRTIVVDTCVGEHGLPGYDLLAELRSTFLDDLASAGFDRHQVDTVLCTHLHFDHVGWNTMRDGDQWVPTFPNARYLIGQSEYAYWKDAWRPESLALTFAEAIVPVVDAGLVDFVETDHRITDEVRLMPTPGHTPGHVSVLIDSEGQQAVISGDVLHHPVQFVAPHWPMIADGDGAAAEATRREFRALYVDRDTLVFGTHFAGSGCGHLRRHGDAYRFDAAP